MDKTTIDFVEVEYINGWMNWRYDYAHIRNAMVGDQRVLQRADADEITFAEVLELAIFLCKRKFGVNNQVDLVIPKYEFGPEYYRAIANGTVAELSNIKLWHITQLLLMGAKIPYRIGLEWSWRELAPTHSGLAVLCYEHDLTVAEAQPKEVETA